MAEVKNCTEPTLPPKRIPDLTTQDSPNEPKKLKLDNPDTTNNGIQHQNDVVPNQKDAENQVVQEQTKEEQNEFEEEEEEPSNGKAVIDRKGKGILIEEDDEDDEDDDDDDDNNDSDSDDSVIGDELSDDSEFADDPLAEVDLDNILPSRTRRKVINPGVYLRNDIPEEEDSDESDDPDA